MPFTGPAEDRLIAQLLDEGLNRSDAMETASELMDRIGPRLTNSPQMDAANEWTRKQLAECLWLRQRVDMHLDAGDSLIVLGDLNDGPGLDEYEKLFGRSGVEVVIGTTLTPERRLCDPHATMELAQRIGLALHQPSFTIPGPISDIY